MEILQITGFVFFFFSFPLAKFLQTPLFYLFLSLSLTRWSTILPPLLKLHFSLDDQKIPPDFRLHILTQMPQFDPRLALFQRIVSLTGLVFSENIIQKFEGFFFLFFFFFVLFTFELNGPIRQIEHFSHQNHSILWI